MAQPEWNWFLARSTDRSIISDLTSITSKSITPQLNSREAASFTISVLDQAAPMVQKISTCIRCFRNGNEVWSGPVWTKSPSGAQGRMQVGCVGWFEMFNHNLLKTGSNPDAGPLPTTTSTAQQYEGWDQCEIAADLVSRAIYDSRNQGAPVYVTMGSTPTNTQPRNINVQRFANIGQQITTMSQMEAGFDFRVDPVTRQLDLYYDPIWPVGSTYGTASVNGRGKVRPDSIFGFKTGPNNLQDVRPLEDASKVENEVYAVGQYAVGEGSEPGAIQSIGLFSSQTSISDQITTDALISFAQEEATTNAYGITVYSFDQLPTMSPAALEPFVDFDIGDVCGLLSNYGSIQIPPPGSSFSGPQPVRLFAFTVQISDEGIESVTNFQTTYQASS